MAFATTAVLLSRFAMLSLSRISVALFISTSSSTSRVVVPSKMSEVLITFVVLSNSMASVASSILETSVVSGEISLSIRSKDSKDSELRRIFVDLGMSGDSITFVVLLLSMASVAPRTLRVCRISAATSLSRMSMASRVSAPSRGSLVSRTSRDSMSSVDLLPSKA